MPQCVASDAELEPLVRTPHTVYVQTFYRIAGQDYCRHHIIKAAVSAGVISEVKPGAGPGGGPVGSGLGEYDHPPAVSRCKPFHFTNPGRRFLIGMV